ncbi:MAG: flagellar hook-basal body complex protein FliE [Thermodesulfobacteriota bacterium]|nr:flagellar hook-basal body complex protein FliE [Thermodesulfobacteriota bacterium]
MNDLKIGNLQQVALKNNASIKSGSQTEFGKVIKGAVDRVNGLERDANRSIVGLLKGKADIHETMINLQKVDISMRLLLKIRNKAVEAYREIMHMQF